MCGSIWTQALSFPNQVLARNLIFVPRNQEDTLFHTFKAQVKAIIKIVKEIWKKKEDCKHRLSIDPHLIHFSKDTTATDGTWSHPSIHNLCTWKYSVSSIHWDQGACEWAEEICTPCVTTLPCHLVYSISVPHKHRILLHSRCLRV